MSHALRSASNSTSKPKSSTHFPRSRKYCEYLWVMCGCAAISVRVSTSAIDDRTASTGWPAAPSVRHSAASDHLEPSPSAAASTFGSYPASFLQIE